MPNITTARRMAQWGLRLNIVDLLWICDNRVAFILLMLSPTTLFKLSGLLLWKLQQFGIFLKFILAVRVVPSALGTAHTVDTKGGNRRWHAVTMTTQRVPVIWPATSNTSSTAVWKQWLLWLMKHAVTFGSSCCGSAVPHCALIRKLSTLFPATLCPGRVLILLSVWSSTFFRDVWIFWYCRVRGTNLKIDLVLCREAPMIVMFVLSPFLHQL